MDENKFWNDENVAEYAAVFLNETFDNIKAQQENKLFRKFTSAKEFREKQQSVSKEKDWEIIERIAKTKNANALLIGGDDAYEIKSVRRLSDGEIISIGDIDEFTGNEVMRIYIENNEMRVLTTSGWKPLEMFKKQNQ